MGHVGHKWQCHMLCLRVRPKSECMVQLSLLSLCRENSTTSEEPLLALRSLNKDNMWDFPGGPVSSG